MKKLIPIVIALAVFLAFGWTLYFLWGKSKTEPVVYKTASASTADITKKTVATGAIVPRQEVEIKPRVSGIVEALYVEAGQYVKRGQEIAKIQIVPDMLSVNRAEQAVKAARIAYNSAKQELARNQGLLDKGVLSGAEFQRVKVDHDLKQQEVSAAESNLQLVKEGASRAAGKVSNVVTSTVEGMVLDVPVKLGTSVIESNTFNAGTTIAQVADMNDMIFEGRVDESEVGKIKEGMKLAIKIGALEKEIFEGTLEYIAPKGAQIDGAIQFEIKAAMVPKEGLFIRAGYSANADIVLDERKQVLAIPESLLQFDKGKPYIEIETAPQVFERREIETGLSDGISIEIKSGLDLNAKIKKPIQGA